MAFPHLTGGTFFTAFCLVEDAALPRGFEAGCFCGAFLTGLLDVADLAAEAPSRNPCETGLSPEKNLIVDIVAYRVP
jgi:hypothetical protein